MIWIAFFCTLAAFLFLGLSTAQHYQRRFGTRPRADRQRLLRLIAWLLLASSLVSAFAARGPVFGPVIWIGLVIFAAASSFLFLNFIAPSKERKS